ncbi:MAG: cryptochrome/photolyase family protein, partial [Cyanobium sp.]
MAPARWLFWHRRDLRLADNLGLAAAAAATPGLTGVFVLDPGILDAPAMAPARLWFLADSLRELAERWRAAGSRLVVLRGDPAELLPRLAAATAAEVVAWNRDVEPYGRERDRRVAAALQAQGQRVLVDWDQLLIAPEALKTGGGDPYRVYGPFWRNWRGQVERKELAEHLTPAAAPHGLVDLNPAALPRPELWQQLPFVEDLAAAIRPDFEGAELCPCRPGEAAALEQLNAFCDGGPLLAYEPDRNVPGIAGTSALSAALKFGTISPRQCWQAAQQARELARSDEQRQAIQVWEQELAWREFYQQALFHFPELADGPYRQPWRHFPWENDPRRFEAWRAGLTGVPIVDAAMR